MVVSSDRDYDWSVSERRTVNCEDHGDTNAAFVCQHLSFSGPARGFHDSTAVAVANDEEPGQESHGWCDFCERARAWEGGWNDVSEAAAKPRLVCTGCFEKLRRLHEGPTRRRRTIAVAVGVLAFILGVATIVMEVARRRH